LTAPWLTGDRWTLTEAAPIGLDALDAAQADTARQADPPPSMLGPSPSNEAPRAVAPIAPARDDGATWRPLVLSPLRRRADSAVGAFSTRGRPFQSGLPGIFVVLVP